MSKPKVNFVYVEIPAWWNDPLWRRWPPEIRGAYWSLCLEIYSAQGPIPNDPVALKRACNWTGDGWEKAWQELKQKFVVSDAEISHKRCETELKRARKTIQSKKRAGVIGAKKRWQSHSTGIASANGYAIAKGKGKGKENKAYTCVGEEAQKCLDNLASTLKTCRTEIDSNVPLLREPQLASSVSRLQLKHGTEMLLAVVPADWSRGMTAWLEAKGTQPEMSWGAGWAVSACEKRLKRAAQEINTQQDLESGRKLAAMTKERNNG